MGPRFVGLFTLTAAISAVWIALEDYGVTDTFTDDVWTLVFPAAALAAYVVMVVMFRRGRFVAAFFGSCAVLAFSLATISAGLYPNMLKSSTNAANSMTVTNASAESYTLTVMLVVAIVGIPFVLLYTAGSSTCSAARSSSPRAATDVDSLSTTALILVFVAGAAATWVAGVFLSDTTDIVDDRFNLGEALGGLILLGIAGTLPEIAITVSAAIQGHLGLATGNLLGGIAMQTLVLVLLDATSRSKTPLTSLSTVLEPIIEAVFVIILVTMALLGPLLPASVAIGSVSPISILIVITWFLGLLILNRLRGSQRWATVTEHVEAQMVTPSPGPVEGVRPNRFQHAKTSTAVLVFALASIVTLIAGVVLEQSGNALANDWGINGVIFGATILASVTALPEVSTGIRAVRLGQVGLAMGDIFGGNQVQMTLFLVADLLAGRPVLQSVDASSGWLGGIGVVVTALFAGGLVLRPPKKFAGIGPDSWLVLLMYAIGLAGLLRIS